MVQRSRYEPEVKLAVIEAGEKGERHRDIAERFEVPLATVKYFISHADRIKKKERGGLKWRKESPTTAQEELVVFRGNGTGLIDPLQDLISSTERALVKLKEACAELRGIRGI